MLALKLTLRVIRTHTCAVGVDHAWLLTSSRRSLAKPHKCIQAAEVPPSARPPALVHTVAADIYASPRCQQNHWHLCAWAESMQLPGDKELLTTRQRASAAHNLEVIGLMPQICGGRHTSSPRSTATACKPKSVIWKVTT